MTTSIKVGSPITITTTVTVADGGEVSGATLSIIGPGGVVRVDDVAMEAVDGSAGVFESTVQTSESWPAGPYKAICRATSGSYTDPESEAFTLDPL